MMTEPETGNELALVLETEADEYCRILNPMVSCLVQAFIRYLKEPRFQTPLTLTDLSRLFANFYKDLNALVVGLYTQSNSVKKQLIVSTEYFKRHPQEFDYLLAIGNYSVSTTKLTKRTDEDALLQLRVFNYLKFATIFKTIEKAQEILFRSCSNPEEEVLLLDKILKFDQRDIIFQEFFEEKIDALKALQLPFASFIEKGENTKLSQVFQRLELGHQDEVVTERLQQILKLHAKINESLTPYAKLQAIVQLQKLIILLVSEVYGGDSSPINNDELIPAFIYLMIYHLPQKTSDSYLNFYFIKNFMNTIDPRKIDFVSGNSSSYNFNNYSPMDRLTKGLSSRSYTKRANLFDLLNLKEEDATDKTSEGIDFFGSDTSLVHYIEQKYFNLGELTFYLTNYEAVLYYLLNITLDQLCPDKETDKQILKLPLEKLVDQDLLTHFKFPEAKAAEEEGTVVQVQEEETRSRSSSLLNAITHRLNDVANSVNRSRSNSSIINSLKSSTLSLNRESFPSLSGHNESGSSNTSPINSHEEHPTEVNGYGPSSSSMVRNIIGRLSLVLAPLNKTAIDEQSIPGIEPAMVDSNTSEPSNDRSISSSSQILSSDHTRTRSSSLETKTQNINAQHQKRNSITTKLTSGVSEFMTKFGNTTHSANASISTLQSSPHKTTSDSSLHSLTDTQAESDHTSTNGEANGTSALLTPKRPDSTSGRSASLQIMDRWFNNLSVGSFASSGNARTSNNTESGSKDLLDADAPYKTLTKYVNVEFDSLSIKDLKDLKNCYDKLCHDLVLTEQPKTTKCQHDPTEASCSDGSL